MFVQSDMVYTVGMKELFGITIFHICSASFCDKQQNAESWRKNYSVFFLFFF